MSRFSMGIPGTYTPSWRPSPAAPDYIVVNTAAGPVKMWRRGGGGSIYDDMPPAPTFRALEPEMDRRLSSIRMDTRGLDRFRDEALRTGDSEWAKRMSAAIRADEGMARDRLAGDIASETATARSNLAMRGGLSSGARERLERSGIKNYLSMSQDIAQKGAAGRLQVGVNDEQNRIQQLGMLPGMEIQALQPEFQKAQLWGASRKYDNDLASNVWGKQLEAWAGAKMADAYRAEADSGSWLCTEAKQDLSKDDWDALRKLKRFALKRNREQARFYLIECKYLVSRMKEAKADWGENVRFVKYISRLIKEGRVEDAFNHYRNVVIALMEKYWPECDHPSYLEVKRV